MTTKRSIVFEGGVEVIYFPQSIKELDPGIQRDLLEVLFEHTCVPDDVPVNYCHINMRVNDATEFTININRADTGLGDVRTVRFACVGHEIRDAIIEVLADRLKMPGLGAARAISIKMRSDCTTDIQISIQAVG